MKENFADSFGCQVFNDAVMQKSLPKDTYESLRRSVDEGLPLDPAIADNVARAMKDWAVSLGATHYTHWFQPMTNITAGKHDSFLTTKPDGSVILEFSGKELVKGEPDASSFPSGGLRNTFEARGYTTWDCTSPAFVRDGTLYIPTAFCAYTGEALDTKTPLLRSMDVISQQALRILRLFGNQTSKRVIATVGAEQEYFLIDREKYEKRLDLKICGRTLFGAKPPKGQEMDDHYCGRIRLRVADFMNDLDHALWQLGVSSKTKHNEVAPAQHELAPIYASSNIACDSNQLTMEMMRIVAKKHGLACLLHEKPFAGVNGSGKHDNWSLSTDDGLNLLDPGKNPYENTRFLLFLSAIIRGVDRYADLLRFSAASPGNDHRLGANEAPPAIISIFLGDQLTDALNRVAHGDAPAENVASALRTGVSTLPALSKDDSDRNRTSPFAFTGNKFEFRMIGSSASIAPANYILNTIVAESLCEFADRLEQCDDPQQEAKSLIAATVKQHGRVIFNGNNYTDAWVAEASRRGLPNLSNTVDAISAIAAEKNLALLEKFGVLSRSESLARYEIMLENYTKLINIEANCMIEMAKRQILPACIDFAGSVAATNEQLAQADCPSRAVRRLTAQLSDAIDSIADALAALEDSLDQAHRISSLEDDARYYRDAVIPAMDQLRAAVDLAETFTSAKAWPMPNYTDLLHHV